MTGQGGTMDFHQSYKSVSTYINIDVECRYLYVISLHGNRHKFSGGKWCVNATMYVVYNM